MASNSTQAVEATTSMKAGFEGLELQIAVVKVI